MYNSANPDYVTEFKNSEKKHIPGIQACEDPARLISTLTALGLVSLSLSEPLKKLAAAAPDAVKNHFQISVYELDRALGEVWTTTSGRMGFKASLARAGILKAK